MNLEPKLEALLLTKKYKELTLNERTWVNQTLTEEEYRHFRLVLCGSSRGLTKTTNPSPHIKTNLMAAMRQKKHKQRPVATFLVAVANYQLPVWQAAAAIACLMFFTLIAKNEIVRVEVVAAEPVFMHDTVFETVYKTDTVFKEQPAVWKKKKNVNVSPSIQGKPKTKTPQFNQPSLGKMTTAPKTDSSIWRNPPNMLLAIDSAAALQRSTYPSNFDSFLRHKPGGRSMREDADLMQFITEMN